MTHDSTMLSDVLAKFCEDVEAAGGVTHRDGVYAPTGDPTWTDIGAIYVKACAALSRVPKIQAHDEVDEDMTEEEDP